LSKDKGFHKVLSRQNGIRFKSLGDRLFYDRRLLGKRVAN